MESLVLRSYQSPGDVVMLTAAVRDLHKSFPERFKTDVRTAFGALWDNNPFLTSLDENDSAVRIIDCHYPLIHRSNIGPWHFIHGYIRFLNERLNISIEPTEFRGDIHLSRTERGSISQVHEMVGAKVPYWIVVAGGKRDYTIKWWAHDRFQAVVDEFREKILFVQVGDSQYVHPPLRGVVNLTGKTDLRQLVRLVHHAQGVLCPVTLAMHLAAAVPTPRGAPKNRPCVVIAGGREPSQWEAYPTHQFLHAAGALWCCESGGCWRSRTTPLNDGDDKDRPENLCADVLPPPFVTTRSWPRNALTYPQDTWPSLLPRCMSLVSVADVIQRIDLYFAGGLIQYLTRAEAESCRNTIEELGGSGGRQGG